MMADSEKRRDVRVPFRTEVTVAYDGEELHFEGDSVNLSMGGMLAESSRMIPLGVRCQVQLRLAGTQEPVELTMTGEVVRHEKEPPGFGIRFEEMDLDSYSILKEIVRHNTQDSDLV
jgi:hypothetical protein